jgi:hypothetical protein
VPEKIIALYCFFDDLLQALHYRDDPQTQLSTAEVMTIAAVAAEFFTGNQQAALVFLSSHHYIRPFSKSRFNRRLHRLPETVWQWALAVLAAFHETANGEGIHLVDTFPIPVCRNIRIKRCKIYRGRPFRGYCSSKREYFFGLKGSLVVTAAGKPVELLLVPGATADISALRRMDLNLPAGSTLFGDSGFLDLTFEQTLAEAADVQLVVPRRANMQDQLAGWLGYLCRVCRKRVETTFSQLADRFARTLHAVTPRGFELKVMLTVLAYSLLG